MVIWLDVLRPAPGLGPTTMYIENMLLCTVFNLVFSHVFFSMKCCAVQCFVVVLGRLFTIVLCCEVCCIYCFAVQCAQSNVVPLMEQVVVTKPGSHQATQ